MSRFFSKLLRNSSRSLPRKRRLGFESLEGRRVMASVQLFTENALFGTGLLINGTNTENNAFTVDYNSGTDVYTITDTNPLTANAATITAGATQVDPNTVTVPGNLISDRVLVRMFNGTNSVVVNGNGGSSWGNEGLQVNNMGGAETITIGAGGVSVQAGAGRGAVALLGDAIVLAGDVTTVNNPITFGDDTTDTIAVSGNSVVNAGTAAVTVNGSVASSNTSDLSVSGFNTQFKNNVSGLGNFVVTASGLVQLDGPGGVNAVSSDISAGTQLRILGTLSGSSAELNSRDIRLASATVDDIVMEAGALSVSGTLNPLNAVGSTAALRSRVPGNAVTVHNQATGPQSFDRLILDKTKLSWFAGYENLIIGGSNNGIQTSSINFVDNPTPLLPFNRIPLPTNTTLIAQSIVSDEGMNLGTFDLDVVANTFTANNPSSFAGTGSTLRTESLAGSEGGDGTLTVNGTITARSGTVALEVAADTSAMINAVAGNYSNVVIESPLASFTNTTAALTSNGDVLFNQSSGTGMLYVNGGIFATGDILLNGSLNLLGDNLFQARGGGGDIAITGAVTGNGFKFELRGINASTRANSINLGGAVSNVSRFAVDHALSIMLKDVSAQADPLGDIFIRTVGNLQIGGNLTAADRVDAFFATADLDAGNRTIDSASNTAINLSGDLNDPGMTLTIDIGAGTFIRNGSNGSVTVTVV